MDSAEINRRLARLGIGEEELRADPEGAEPGSGLIVLNGFLLNRFADHDRRPGMLLGSIAVPESKALAVIDELAPGWRTSSDS
jgi:hypothetical protein